MLDLDKLSLEGILGKYQEIIKIILDYFNLVGGDGLIIGKIPTEKFAPKFHRNEIEAVVNRMAEEEDNIIHINERAIEFKRHITILCDEKLAQKEKTELENNIFLAIRDKDKLKELLKRIDKKLSKFKKGEIYKKKKIFDLPSEAIWEDLEIKFKDEFEVEIYFKKKFFTKSDNIKMEFFRAKTKDKKPEQRWRLLKELSNFTLYSNKKLAIQPTIEDIARTLKINNENCMKLKEKLSDKLQEIFGIYDDPFYNYKDRGFYQTRFKLTPEPALRGDRELY